MIVATAGHVDHGKTTLVRTLTGIDTDRLPEEKARGMSIDLGFAYLRRADRAPIAFVDVPGHERFVRNMIAGVHTIDLALLVVAADDGPMPQTLEHLRILELLGAPRAAVVLTKIDRVDPAHRAQSQSAVEALVAGSRFAGAPLFAVSAQTGEGLPALLDFLLGLADAPALVREAGGVFRMHVDRVFVLQGLGVVATGAVVAGRIAAGDEVFLPRTGRSGRVRSLRANDTETPEAVAGQRCALNLPGFSRGDLERGDVLVGIAGPGGTRRIEVELDAAGAHALRRGHAVLVCIGAQAVRGTATPVTATPVTAAPAAIEGPSDDTASGAAAPAADTAPSTGAAVLAEPQESRLATSSDAADPRFVRLSLAAPIVAFHGDRLLLRDAGSDALLAGGRVLDTAPPERGRARQLQPSRLAVLAAGSPGPPLVAALLALPAQVIDLDWLARIACAPAGTVSQWLQAAGGIALEGSDARLAVSPANLVAASEALLAAVDAWHRDHPDRLGATLPVLLESLRDWPAALPRAALRAQLSAGALSQVGPFVRRSGHRPVLTPAETVGWQQIAPALGGDGDGSDDLKAPRVLELAERFGRPAAEIEQLLGRAAEAGFVYRVSRNRFFLPRAVVALATLAHTLAAENPAGTFYAAQFRDRSKLGRNLTIEVLEFLDAMGITRRVGAVRHVVGSPESLRTD